MLYHSPTASSELAEQENKLASKLTELGHVKCPQCTRKLVRVFAPHSGRTPIFRGDVKDYLRRMRKAMKTCEAKGAKSECHISGPEYILIYNSSHFNKPYSDNLGTGRNYGTCSTGAYLGHSPVDIVSRILLKHRLIRQACVANGVMPDEVRAFLDTLDIDKLDLLLGYGFNLRQIDNTKLWAGTYKYNQWHANTVDYNVNETVGVEWAAEMDPIVSNPPPLTGRRGKYVMSPTHGAIQYSSDSNMSNIAIDLPDGMLYTDLTEYGHYRIINIYTVTGVPAKIKVSYEGAAAKSMNNLTRMLNRYNVPRKFWVIQPWAFHGSTTIETGDIIL